jgi:hypothetical protein
VYRHAGVAAAALTFALTAGACGSGGSGSAATAERTPSASNINRADFVRAVDNPWFPLRPGSVYRYRGVKDGKPSTDVLKVTHRTKTILGVTTTAVSDRLYERGKLEEVTTDWYAQDRQGNVWYFGEDTKELDSHGHVKSTEGSWQAGVDGAEQGVYMRARPRVGQRGRQEYYKGHAEDHFQVIRVHASVKVPYRSFRNALETKEWTPLEPGVIDTKYYVRGVGTVLEQTVKGGNERNVLVSFKRR